MNFAFGRLIPAEERNKAIKALPSQIVKTLSAEPLSADLVIDTCNTLSQSLDETYIGLLVAAGLSANKAQTYLAEAKKMLSAEYLQNKVVTELGFLDAGQRQLSSGGRPATEKVLPLGVLFHIVAGNVDALPAYSIIEGLLAGNINIVKLPSSDNDLSVLIIDQLVRIEPRLADYVYIFDFSSQDTEELEFLASLADAIVVWGGDEAIRAARVMAQPNTRIIEWGHKLSFAYGVPGAALDEDLAALAQSIVESRQLTCSSCQGLFIDTDKLLVIHDYAERLCAALDSYMHDEARNIGIQAQVWLKVYAQHLEEAYKPQKVYRGAMGSVIACENSILEPAIQFGNCWVKPLPQKDILAVLRPYKNHLQTCTLICPDDDYKQLSENFWRSGIVRVCKVGESESAYPGMPHDGEYSLRRYTRTVSR